jgi:hypothetical protein
MDMSHQQNFTLFVICCICLFLSLITINLYLGKRYHFLEELTIDPEIEGLVMGSSRAGGYDLDYLSKKLGGIKIKKLNAPSAPYKWLYIRLVDAYAHAKIKYILLNLDLVAANKDLESGYPIEESLYVPERSIDNPINKAIITYKNIFVQLTDCKIIKRSLRANAFHPNHTTTCPHSAVASSVILAKSRKVEDFFINGAYFLRPNRVFVYNPWNRNDENSSLYYLQKIMSFCHKHNIKLDLPIGPTHARFAELEYNLGLHGISDQWKRDLVKLNETIAAEYHHAPFNLIDFSGYNKVTTEDLTEDKKVHYYTESSHFNFNAGNIVIDQLFNFSKDQIGNKLTHQNIAKYLERYWKPRHHFIANFSRKYRDLYRLLNDKLQERNQLFELAQNVKPMRNRVNNQIIV